MKYSASTIFFSLIVLLSILGNVSTEMTSLEQSQLITAVNRFRQHAAKGENRAENMRQIHWDDQLARMAQYVVNKCECEDRLLSRKIGITSLQLKKDKHSVQDMIESLLRSSETRPYLMHADFQQMGCAINANTCGENDEYDFICYWYPQCGNILDVNDEVKGIFSSDNSENKAEEYEEECPLPIKVLSDNCEHNNKVTLATWGIFPCRNCKRIIELQQLTCEKDESQVYEECQENAIDSDSEESFEGECPETECFACT